MATIIGAEAAVNLLRLPPLPSIKDILKIYKLKAVKQLSQNFILDYKVTNKIVKTAGKVRGCHVLEVGPGPGGITRAILERGATKVVVVEKDTRFKPCLDMLAEAVPNQLEIIYGDILTTPLDQIFPKELAQPWDASPPKIHIIGNLPFSISTPLIIRWLKAMSERSGIFTYGRVRMTLTFQQEVAERMAAGIMHAQRCRLSTICQYLANVEYNYTISGSACIPTPDVNIGVVRLTPHVEPHIKLPFPLVEKVMRHVFHHRQKEIRNNVKTLFPHHLSHLTMEMFLRADVEPTSRSFELGIAEFDRLCRVYSALCDENPGLIDFDYRSHEEVAKLKQWLRENETKKKIIVVQ